MGTLVLSSGGLVQGIVGHDEAFTLSLVIGITIIYGGFLVAERDRAPSLDAGDGGGRSSRRSSFPDGARGSSSTTVNVVGHL